MCVSRRERVSASRASSVGSARGAVGRPASRRSRVQLCRRGRRLRVDDRGDPGSRASRVLSGSARRSATSVAQRERRTAVSEVSSTISRLWRSSSTVHPAGRNGKSACDLVDERAATGVDDRPQPSSKRNSRWCWPIEVDHREVALAGGTAQAASKLLREHRRAVASAEAGGRVSTLGHVDALAENVDREHAAELDRPASARRAAVTLSWRVVPGERDAREAGLSEPRAM